MIGTVCFDGILRSKRHKRHRQLVSNAVNGYLKLFHSLQQRGLHLRRGAVYLVRQQKIAHSSTLAVSLRTRSGVYHGVADNVRGHKVGGKLNTPEAARNGLREGFCQQRFADSGHVLDKHMTLRQHCADDLLYHTTLTYYHLFNILYKLFNFRVHIIHLSIIFIDFLGEYFPPPRTFRL